MIDDFNNWIYQARKQRLPILIRGNFIDIFIVCLNEELQILKSSEEQEDKLSHSVNLKLSAVHDMEVIRKNMVTQNNFLKFSGKRFILSR